MEKTKTKTKTSSTSPLHGFTPQLPCPDCGTPTALWVSTRKTFRGLRYVLYSRYQRKCSPCKRFFEDPGLERINENMKNTAWQEAQSIKGAQRNTQADGDPVRIRSSGSPHAL